MESNSNFRKRRLLEDTVTSSNCLPQKRDAATSTTNSTPMTLDMYTQTDEDKKDTVIPECLQNKFDQIFKILSRHDDILKEIRAAVSIGSPQACESTTTGENVNYKIISDDGNAITIEAVKPEDIIEEPIPYSSDITYVTEQYENSNNSPSAYYYENKQKTTPKECHEERYEPSKSTPTILNKVTHSAPDTNNLRSETPNTSKQIKFETKYGGNFSETPKHKQPPRRMPLCDAKQENGGSASSEELIAIGTNGTLVPKSILETMKWDSASCATRKLLTAIFDRLTLATHSLTGRPSPAFHGREKPAKNQLDAGKVADIISIVSKCCNVPEKEVRNAITTKCADENKMHNQRLRREQNKEN
ncbi:unnamed protein product [Hermetia illucens]|uniref:BEN domain-containing protein n=2 Tax=Hermetia illucens TaxID=343691 RepID=A0A7R8UF11_HERIL|nr:unnamed protein product [Hermetia illucens]